ncbi:g6661 [Coccomyxa viridis]|uniref:Alpha-1,3-mannosyl-glycoprotein 2-beta-N-acetylglucosaminyltransferase n=1 Tax=Coccomyxa viridis TaxID=1274662 RepID=A0ABP1FY86_9CHLO
MRLGVIVIVIGAVLLFGVQVLLFGGYTRDLTGLTSQAQQSRELHEQLTRALESNANLSRLFTSLNSQFEDILTDQHSGQNKGGRKETQASLRGIGQISSRDSASTPDVLKLPRDAPERRVYPSGNEAEECVGGLHNTDGTVAAVVTVAFNRPDYLERHVASLLNVHSSDPANRRKFPLFISQDGTPVHEATRHQAQSYKEVSYLHHRELIKPVTKTSNAWDKLAYYRIANHYKHIFKTFFDCFEYPHVIILEDDMELAPDFFTYFEALAPLLDKDDMLMCVSSWNDHGQVQFVKDTRRLYRTDFFPGLGWMLRRQLWEEFRDNWPQSFWDDWMRDNSTRKGRHCIRPEVCRTYNFGEVGSSIGMYYDTFLAPTRLNDDLVPWLDIDLSYLQLPRYDRDMEVMLEAAPKAETAWDAQQWHGDVRLQYKSQKHFEQLAVAFGMMAEWRDGVPRAAYHGVVIIHYEEARVFLEPTAAVMAEIARTK